MVQVRGEHRGLAGALRKGHGDNAPGAPTCWCPNLSLPLCPQQARGQGLQLLSHPSLRGEGKCVRAPESKLEPYMFKLASSVFVIEL